MHLFLWMTGDSTLHKEITYLHTSFSAVTVMSGRGPEALAVVIILYIASFISRALRLYTHGFILKHFFAEDYISLATLVYSAGI
jgi:hypothetical protein